MFQGVSRHLVLQGCHFLKMFCEIVVSLFQDFLATIFVNCVSFLKDDRRKVERQLRRQRFVVTLRCFKAVCRHLVFQGCQCLKNLCLRCVSSDVAAFVVCALFFS